MNFYSKLSRDKSGAPVKWKMSRPIHVDEAAISGRLSPARASSTGSRLGSHASDAKKRFDGDKSGKKSTEKSSSTERSKSRDSSSGSKSRKSSIERKPEVETKTTVSKHKIKSHESRPMLTKNKGYIAKKLSKGKRVSLSALAAVSRMPDKMKRRPHSLNLTFNSDTALNGEAECFKSPDRLSPCNEVIKRKKGRPKQTPPKLEIETLIPIISAGEPTQETYSSKQISNCTSVAACLKQNKNQVTADTDISDSIDERISPAEALDQTDKNKKRKYRPRGRPPGSLNRSTLLIMNEYDTQNMGNIRKLKKQLYTGDIKPGSSKYKSLINKSKNAQLKNKVDKTNKQIEDNNSDKLHEENMTTESEKTLIKPFVDKEPKESAVIVDLFNMNGDIDDPEVTFKTQILDSHINDTPYTQLVKHSKREPVKRKGNLKKSTLKTKATPSLTQFKKCVESAPKVKKKRVIISHAVNMDDDSLTNLATNDLRRKIQKKLIDKLNGRRKEETKSKYVENESTLGKTVEENKTKDKPILEFQMTEYNNKPENKFNSKPDNVSEVESLSAIIEQKRLLSKENSKPDKIRRKPGRPPKVQPVRTDKETSDIGKQSDTESICSELSVQSTRSQTTDRKRKITTSDKVSDDERLIRTRQRCEIIPPGGSRRKRTLSGEFHLLDEFKLRKKQRNMESSEDNDEDGRKYLSGTNLVDIISSSSEPDNILLQGKEVHVPVKDRKKQKRVKNPFTKGKSMLVRKKFSQPFQKKRLLSPTKPKGKKVASKIINKKATIAQFSDTFHANVKSGEEKTARLPDNGDNNLSLSVSVRSDSINRENKEIENVDNVTKERNGCRVTKVNDKEVENVGVSKQETDVNITVMEVKELENAAVTKQEYDINTPSAEGKANENADDIRKHEFYSKIMVVNDNDIDKADNDTKQEFCSNKISAEEKVVAKADDVPKQEFDNTSVNVLEIEKAHNVIDSKIIFTKVKEMETVDDHPNLELDNKTFANDVMKNADVLKQEFDSDITFAEDKAIEHVVNAQKQESNIICVDIETLDNPSKQVFDRSTITFTEDDVETGPGVQKQEVDSNKTSADDKIIQADTTEQEFDYKITSSEVVLNKPVTLSTSTDVCQKLKCEQNVMNSTDEIEFTLKDNSDAQGPNPPTDHVNEDIKCDNAARTGKTTNRQAILISSSTKVDKTDSDVNSLKGKLEMNDIAFDVNEVVQGILYSVEHTLEELGNVNLLKKLAINAEQMSEDLDVVDKENVTVLEANDETVNSSDSNVHKNNSTIESSIKHKCTKESEKEITIEDDKNETSPGSADIVEKDDQHNNDNPIDEVDTNTAKNETDLIRTDDVAILETGITEEVLYGPDIPNCKVSPESQEVTSIIGKTKRKRNYGNKGSKDVNVIGRKIQLRQKISRSPLDNIALKHSIEENEYYKNEAIKANKREAKLKLKQAALHAKTPDPVTNDSVPMLDIAISKINPENTDLEQITQESSLESDISDIVSDTDTQTPRSRTTDELLNCCKPCSVLLVDFIKQLQINQQKMSETGSESGEKILDDDDGNSTHIDFNKPVSEEPKSDELESRSKKPIVSKQAKGVRRPKPSLDSKLILAFGNLESESGEQTARKTVPPLKLKLKGGVRRKTYMVEPSLGTEAKKAVGTEIQNIKGKSTSKSDSDSEIQKLHHHHHKKRTKAQSLDPVPADHVNVHIEASPCKQNLQPPVVPNDAYEANFLEFIKEKESKGGRVPTIASATVSGKSVNQTADGKAYKVQANGSLTVSASGTAATCTSTSKADIGLNEAAIAAQKKKAENAGQIMESYAKFREKIMNESVGKNTVCDSNELGKCNLETIESDKNSGKCNIESNAHAKQTDANAELVTDVNVNMKHSEKTDAMTILKRFVCSHCDFSSDTTFVMLDHTKSKHANDIKYICPLCEKVYIEKEAILHHCETAHIGQHVLYNCVPDFHDRTSEMDRLPTNETDNANHGNIFDRINDLLEFNGNTCNKLRGDVNSLQTHYLKTSAEADSTTEVPSVVNSNDKRTEPERNSAEADKISRTTVAAEKQEDSGEMQIKIVDVVSLKDQAEPTALPSDSVVTRPVPGIVSHVNSAPQTQLKIPSFTARGFPHQPREPEMNKANSAQVVKDTVIPKKSGKLGNTFKCEKCNVHAPLLAAMVAHLRNVHREIPRLFQCPYCRDLEAETEKKIHDHIKLFHPTDNPNPPVALSEPAKSNLKTLSIPLPENRFNDSALVEKDIYMCLNCKTHMPSLETIYDHLEAEHIEVFVSVCPFCKTFKSKDEEIVNQHIISSHQRSIDELPLSLAIDGNQFLRVPSLIKDKHKHGSRSTNLQQTAKATQPESQSNVMSLTQQNLQRHQLLQQRELLNKQGSRLPTNPGIARMISQVNPRYMSAIDQSQLMQAVPQQRPLMPQTFTQASVQQKHIPVSSKQHSAPHPQLVQGAKKRKLNLSDTIANLTMQKQAEQKALVNKNTVSTTSSSATSASPLPTYEQAVGLRNQTQQGHQSSQALPPPLLRGPPPLIRFDQLMGPGDGTAPTNQTLNISSNPNMIQNASQIVAQRLATGSPLGMSQQISQGAKPIQSALFDTSSPGSFAPVNRKPVLNIPLVPRSGNRLTSKPSGGTLTGSPLDLSSKSTPSSSPAPSPSPSPNIPTENPDAFKIFNLKPNTQAQPVQQFVHQVRPNTSNTLAYRPVTPHIPNVSQGAQVMSMPLNAALLGGNVIVSIPNMPPNIQTVQQLQALQQLVRLGTPAQNATTQLQNLQQLVRVGTPGQSSSTSIQQALQTPRAVNIGLMNQGVQQITVPTLPSPTMAPQQINMNINLPMFKCPYCPKLTKLAPAEVQPHIETLHPGSSIVFKQCDT